MCAREAHKGRQKDRKVRDLAERGELKRGLEERFVEDPKKRDLLLQEKEAQRIPWWYHGLAWGWPEC
jgi:hypothetical protein